LDGKQLKHKGRKLLAALLEMLQYQGTAQPAFAASIIFSPGCWESRVIIDAVDCPNDFPKIKENWIMPDIKYEIVKKIGVISKAGSGWAKELNLISWNDREPKYDLRDWSADGSKMGKGVTLSKDELIALRELLNSLEL
jgi:hypothetical protein